MTSSAKFLNASQAARSLGISAKALRLYEQHGLIMPTRTVAGWRAYGPDDMRRAGEIVTLRALGFSLAQVARVLDGEFAGLEPALAAHQAALEGRMREIGTTVEKVRGLRADLARGEAPAIGDLAKLLTPENAICIAFDLPWPWGGEHFELRDIGALTYITGPLGSGKTRLARRIAETLPNAAFLGLDRLAGNCAHAYARLDGDDALKTRVERTCAWLVDDGGKSSDALIALLAGLEMPGPSALVIDMIEQDLDEATQKAVIAYLRRRAPGARPIFALTRSTAILDLEAAGRDETILFCPANHGMPMRVAPCPGTPGYEALSLCLASPDVRARTAGVIAWRHEVA